MPISATTPTRKALSYLPGSREYRRIAVAMFLAGLSTFATVHTTQPLLPELRAYFGLTPAQSALSMSATTITLGMALLVVGPLSDSLGRLVVMRWSLLLSALFTVAVGLAPSWGWLLALRACVGASVAGLAAVAVAYLREEIAPRAIARATGLYIGGTGIGGMAGRLVAGLAADFFGWRAAVVAVGVVALGCGIACWALLPASRGFTSTTYSLNAVTRRFGYALRDPHLLALDVVGLVTMGALNATFNAITFRLKGAPYGLSQGVMSLVFLVYILGSVASARAGKAADKVGPAFVVLAAVGLGLLGTGLTLATPLGLVLAGVALITVGFFAAHGVASGWVTARAQQRGHGMAQATSIYLFFYYVGASSMGYLGGWAWSAGAWGRVALVCALLWSIGLVATLAIAPRQARGTGSRNAQGAGGRNASGTGSRNERGPGGRNASGTENKQAPGPNLADDC